jgi:hypothetical protein
MSTTQQSLEEFYGPVISRYTRAQAIDDGVLVDVSALAREAGIGFPTVITAGLHALCTPPKGSCQDYTGRLWDVLSVLRMRIRLARDPIDRITFLVKIGARNEPLYAVCGPDDTGAPCITILKAGED